MGDVTGLAADAFATARDPSLLNFGLMGLGALPFVPSVGTIKRLGSEGFSDKLGRAFEQFGRTRNLDEAGFIAAAGKFVDLSSYQTREGGFTFTNHRHVSEALGYDPGIDGLLKFQQDTGLVRYNVERNSLSAPFVPDAKAVQPVVQRARKNRASLEVDFDDPIRKKSITAEITDPTVEKVLAFFRRASVGELFD